MLKCLFWDLLSLRINHSLKIFLFQSQQSIMTQLHHYTEHTTIIIHKYPCLYFEYEKSMKWPSFADCLCKQAPLVIFLSLLFTSLLGCSSHLAHWVQISWAKFVCLKLQSINKTLHLFPQRISEQMFFSLFWGHCLLFCCELLSFIALL